MGLGEREADDQTNLELEIKGMTSRPVLLPATLPPSPINPRCS